MLKEDIFAGGELELLQMVSEPDTRRCASEDAGSPRRWIARSHIGWRVLRTIGRESHVGMRPFGEAQSKATRAYTQSGQYHTIVEIRDS